MQIRHKTPFARAYTPLVSRSGAMADMLQDFGVLKLFPGDTWEQSSESDEQCWLLTGGNAHISWALHGGNSQAAKTSEADIVRPDLFDHSPWCLSVPAGTKVAIQAGKDGAEFCYSATDNPRRFAARPLIPQSLWRSINGSWEMKAAFGSPNEA